MAPAAAIMTATCPPKHPQRNTWKWRSHEWKFFLAQGSTAIAALVRQAQGRISIMAGGGVRPKNVESLIRLTGVSAVHSACSRSALP